MRSWQPVKVSILPLLVQSQVSKAVRRTGYIHSFLWAPQGTSKAKVRNGSLVERYSTRWWAALVSSQLPSKGTVLQTAAFADSLPTHIFKTPYCISNKSIKLVKLLLVSYRLTPLMGTISLLFFTPRKSFLFFPAL